jgi:hypothetical protein
MFTTNGEERIARFGIFGEKRIINPAVETQGETARHWQTSNLTDAFDWWSRHLHDGAQAPSRVVPVYMLRTLDHRI